jgi:hypothetical protein
VVVDGPATAVGALLAYRLLRSARSEHPSAMPAQVTRKPMIVFLDDGRLPNHQDACLDSRGGMF